MNQIILIIIIIFSAYSTNAINTVVSRQNFIIFSKIDGCEGKDISNYTQVSYVGVFTKDQACDLGSKLNIGNRYLITKRPDEPPVINTLLRIAVSNYPNGAHLINEELTLITDGLLQGKYTYIKSTWLVSQYLSKCSSVLGYSLVPSKKYSLLIVDHIDIVDLLRPSGAYDSLDKHHDITRCSGRGAIV